MKDRIFFKETLRARDFYRELPYQRLRIFFEFCETPRKNLWNVTEFSSF